MSSDRGGAGRPAANAQRTVTIRDLAAELGLSITTISRALAGYSDVGEKTRERVREAADRLGYRPNRNAQRLVTRRTHNIAWVQPDNDRKFLDPHFVEVMAGALRGARIAHYDILVSSDVAEREMAAYRRYVLDNSVDGFIIDLPRTDDPRITYLLEAERAFVVHGRETRHESYGWVDVDNYGIFYRLARLLLANGHRHIAFINGDETYNYALYRCNAVRDAALDHGLPPETFAIFNSTHPMGDAGFKLTKLALEDRRVSAVLYSSALMAVEGHGALAQAGREPGGDIAIATMDDALHYLDLERFAGRWTFCRSSLRDAGQALIEELARQCDTGEPPRGTLIPAYFFVHPGLGTNCTSEPLPEHRQNTLG